MTVSRFVFCLVAIVAISLMNVYYRAQAVHDGYQLGRVQKESADLRVKISYLEGKVSALASPARLRAENERLQLGLVAPSGWQTEPTAVADATRYDIERGLVRR